MRIIGTWGRAFIAGATLLGLGAPPVLIALVPGDRTPAPVVREESLSADPGVGRSRVEGLSILRRWDERRAAAWAAGDEEALAALYTVDSAAGLTDRAMLRRWSGAGMVVESMRTQIKGATVVARSEHRLVITTTDRIVGARAVSSSGERWLPEDRWTTRRVTMRLVGTAWLVAGVRKD